MNQTTELPLDPTLIKQLIDLVWKVSDAILEIYHSGELKTEVKEDQSPVTGRSRRSSCTGQRIISTDPKNSRSE